MTKYFCEYCNTNIKNKTKHEKTIKHIKNINKDTTDNIISSNNIKDSMKSKYASFFKSGGDLQQSITENKFLKHFATGKYPGEFHLKSLNPFNKTNPTHQFAGYMGSSGLFIEVC